ncbi:MAG TPA: hypothetical protein GXZ51_04905, partial [Acholeplasma sp.]|nr:hypothetical protein [Acholeplasma sp.]
MINLSPLLNNKNEKKPLSEVFELKNGKPSIINTAGKVVTGIGGFVKDILLEAPARAAAALTLEATKQESLKPTSPIEKFFLGDEEVKKVSTMIEEAGKTGRELFVGKEAKTFGEVAGKVLTIGSVALDLTPFGGIRKNLVKTLTSLKNVKKIEVVLKNAGVADDLIAIYAPKFAKLKKSKEVSEGLKSLESIIKETKYVQPIATDVIKGVDTELAKEAIKYKTASEFIKAQGTPVYHGGSKVLSPEDFRDAIKSSYADERGALFTSSDKQVSEMFGKQSTELYPKLKNPLIIDAKKNNYYEIPIPKELRKDFHSSMKTTDTDSLVEIAQERGHDGVIIKNVIEGAGEYDPADARNVIIGLKKDSFITKSQLIDIWNKAQDAIKTTTKATDKLLETKPETFTSNAIEIGATNKLPMVVRGDTFI